MPAVLVAAVKKRSVPTAVKGVDAEQENEEGRHEGAAAHAGHPSQDTNAEAGQRIGPDFSRHCRLLLRASRSSGWAHQHAARPP